MDIWTVIAILWFAVFGIAALICAEKGWHFIGRRRTEADPLRNREALAARLKEMEGEEHERRTG